METENSQYQKMTGTPIPKLVTTLAVPTMISMIVTSLYNMADTYFVSLLNDRSATGAVGVVFSLMAMLQAVSFMIGMGSGSWISRLLGRRELERANTVGSTGFLMSIVTGIIFAVVGELLIDPLMFALGATPTILPYAKSYGRYILYAAPVMMGSFIMNNILRSEGKARFAMIGIATGNVLNLILDPIFIFDWGLGMKVGGAALATAISQCVSFTILLVPYVMGKTTTKFRLRSISAKPSVWFRILRNGLPSFCRQGLASLATIIMNHSIAIYAPLAADAAIAAMGIVNRIFMFIFSIVIGFGQGYQPVVGFNYGAKKFGRVREAFNFTLKTTTVMMLVCTVIGFLVSSRVMGLFAKGQADPDVVAIGTEAFRARCASLVFMPLGTICNMTFQSTGRSWTSSLLSSCRQGIFYIPLMLLLPGLIGLTGVTITQSAADGLTFIVCIPFILSFMKEIKTKEAELSPAI